MAKTAVVTTPGETDSFQLGPNGKQGTVLGPVISSAGGGIVGTSQVRSLAFVDDIAGLNHNIKDAHDSHNVVTLFSKKKRLPLNEDKCIIIPVNVPTNAATPVLYVNEKEMDICEIIKYQGDIYHSRGNNNDLVKDRVKNVLKCMISTLALGSEITYGIYLIQTLLSL